MPGDERDEVGEVGKRYGRLTVTAEADWYHPPGGGRRYRRWLCVCDCGEERVVRQSDLRSGAMVSCGCRKREYQPEVKYRSAHLRVKRSRGPASTHVCIDCDRPADEWSYDHGDPNEVFYTREDKSRPYTIAYSADPSRYVPRCRSCHVKFDKEHKRRAA